MSSKPLLRISSICTLSNGSGVELSAPRIFSSKSSSGVTGAEGPGAIPCMMSDSARTGPSKAMTRRGDEPNTTKAFQRVLCAHVLQECPITGTELITLFGILIPPPTRSCHAVGTSFAPVFAFAPRRRGAYHFPASFPHLEASSPTGHSCASLSLVQHARINFISMPHDLFNSHFVLDAPVLRLRSVSARSSTILRSSLPGEPRTGDQGQRYLPRRLLPRRRVCLPSFRQRTSHPLPAPLRSSSNSILS